EGAEASDAASRQAARTIADLTDRDLLRLADDLLPELCRSEPSDLRTALGVIAGMADAVADGAIGPSQAGPALAILMDELATLVDLKALAEAASEERRSVLNGTAGLIGELIVADESQDEDAGDEERDQRRVPTLTVLLESRGQHTWPEVHAELRSADV